MRHILAWVVALSLPVVLMTGSALAQKEKDKGKDADKDLDKAKDVWIKAGVVSGKVVAVYEDKRRLRVSIPVPKLDVGQVNAMQQAQLSYAQAARSRDVNGMRQAQMSLAQAQARLYTMENTDIEVQAVEDVVVRAARPKTDYDDKGNPKKLTKEELKEQKGDSKQPGYKAEFSDIQTDSIVQLTVVRKKNAPKAKPKVVLPKKKGKGVDDMPDVEGLLEDTPPQVSLIMIVLTPPPGK